MSELQRAIRRQVRALLGEGSHLGTRTPADQGLFGPESVAWRVHGDVASMMAGGVSALLLQMLHPRALAAVWDHSDFRTDMRGRLRRTAQFIAGTTYGSSAHADALIARVRHVHDRIEGHLPDGTPYAANDPELLTFVHVAEVWSFLAAHRLYVDPGLTLGDQDRYFTETATVAERLGATDVPKSRDAVETYLAGIRPTLTADRRVHKVARALINQRADSLWLAPVLRVSMTAGIDLLPRWAADMHALDLSPASRRRARIGLRSLRSLVRWAMTETPKDSPVRPVRPAQAA